MSNQPNAFYDEKPEECMYPLEDETDERFKKRLENLRIKRRITMTEKDIALATLFAEGRVTTSMLEVVEE